MNVTVMIPVRNAAQNVAVTMESLFAQTRLPDEVVVADGCSTDDTVKRIEAFGNRGVPIRVVRNESLFAGGGRNVATRTAAYDLLVNLDVGNRADPNWLAAMVAAFEEDPSLEYVGGVFYPMFDTWFERVSASIIYFEDTLGTTWTLEELKSKARFSGVIGGMCMAYRRPIWQRAGGFAEWARKGQDRLFSLRVDRVGGKAGLTLHAVMYHHMARSFHEAFDRHFHYGLWAARIGLPTPRFRRLLGTYALGVCVAGASLFISGLAWSIPALVAAYIYVGAWRKLVIIAKATSKPFSAKAYFCAIVILFVKDAAVLSGSILGSLDRLVRPRWRRMTREYLQAGR